MSDRAQPLLTHVGAAPGGRRSPSAVKIGGALLGCVGLLFVVVSSRGPSGTTTRNPIALAHALADRRGGVPAQTSAMSLDASVFWKRSRGGRGQTECSYSKEGCQGMILAKGNRNQTTRNLTHFEDLVVNDIIQVLSYEVDPSAQPSITFTASSSLLGTFTADVVDRSLIVGTGCACLDNLGRNAITARIVNTVWPGSLHFRDASHGILADIAASSVSCEGAAGLEVSSLGGTAAAVRCTGAAHMEIGSVQVHGVAGFGASGDCHLSIAAGSANVSEVVVGGAAHVNLGTFAAQSTQVRIGGASHFQGQVAQKGQYEATGVSKLESTVKDGGRVACSGVAHICLHTSHRMATDQQELCTIDIVGG